MSDVATMGVGIFVGVALTAFAVLWNRAFYDAWLINKTRQAQWNDDTEWAHKHKMLGSPPPDVRCVR